MKSLLFFLLLSPIGMPGQTARQDSLWRPMTQLIGTWHGEGGGEPGVGTYERTYSPLFGGKFIEVRNKSVYPPTDKNPRGEIHEDIGYISYDKIRRTFILRQFHAEGFVNQYVIDSLSADGKLIVLFRKPLKTSPAVGGPENRIGFSLPPPSPKRLSCRLPASHLKSIPRSHCSKRNRASTHMQSPPSNSVIRLTIDAQHHESRRTIFSRIPSGRIAPAPIGASRQAAHDPSVPLP